MEKYQERKYNNNSILDGMNQDIDPNGLSDIQSIAFKHLFLVFFC